MANAGYIPFSVQNDQQNKYKVIPILSVNQVNIILCSNINNVFKGVVRSCLARLTMRHRAFLYDGRVESRTSVGDKTTGYTRQRLLVVIGRCL